MSAQRHVEQSLFPEIKPNRPVGYIVPSVFVGSNAELVAAVAPMYLTGSVMDCTSPIAAVRDAGEIVATQVRAVNEARFKAEIIDARHDYLDGA